MDHGFLLRFVPKDKKGIIVVGDSREQIEEAFKNALEVQEKEGDVSGPRKLGVPGARYVN